MSRMMLLVFSRPLNICLIGKKPCKKKISPRRRTALLVNSIFLFNFAALRLNVPFLKCWRSLLQKNIDSPLVLIFAWDLGPN